MGGATDESHVLDSVRELAKLQRATCNLISHLITAIVKELGLRFEPLDQ